jgi:hypothetical protein
MHTAKPKAFRRIWPNEDGGDVAVACWCDILGDMKSSLGDDEDDEEEVEVEVEVEE